MFGRRFWQFDSPFAQRDWEGWTPPWLQRDWSGPRGPRTFGRPPFGHHGPFGPGGQWGSPEQQALMREAAEVAQLFAIAGRRALSNPENLKRQKLNRPDATSSAHMLRVWPVGSWPRADY